MVLWKKKKWEKYNIIITHKQTLWSHRIEPPGKSHKQRINSVYLSKATNQFTQKRNKLPNGLEGKIKRRKKIYRNHVVKIIALFTIFGLFSDFQIVVVVGDTIFKWLILMKQTLVRLIYLWFFYKYIFLFIFDWR